MAKVKPKFKVGDVLVVVADSRHLFKEPPLKKIKIGKVTILDYFYWYISPSGKVLDSLGTYDFYTRDIEYVETSCILEREYHKKLNQDDEVAKWLK